MTDIMRTDGRRVWTEVEYDGTPLAPKDVGQMAGEIARRWNAHDNLLSALQSIESAVMGGSADWISVMRTVRAAIAKARGEG